MIFSRELPVLRQACARNLDWTCIRSDIGVRVVVNVSGASSDGAYVVQLKRRAHFFIIERPARAAAHLSGSAPCRIAFVNRHAGMLGEWA